MTEIVPELKKSPKPKRKYNRKPAPPAPIAPNPTVEAMEKDVLSLVQQRMAANEQIVNATVAVNLSASNLQVAQMRLSQIVSEVQYRMGLIAQLKGGTTSQVQGMTMTLPPFPPDVDRFDVYSSNGAPVGSIPAPPTQRQVQTGPRIRSESAESVRAEEVGVRAAI
jgi:hypothetical protein